MRAEHGIAHPSRTGNRSPRSAAGGAPVAPGAVAAARPALGRHPAPGRDLPATGYRSIHLLRSAAGPSGVALSGTPAVLGTCRGISESRRNWYRDCFAKLFMAREGALQQTRHPGRMCGGRSRCASVSTREWRVSPPLGSDSPVVRCFLTATTVRTARALVERGTVDGASISCIGARGDRYRQERQGSGATRITRGERTPWRDERRSGSTFGAPRERLDARAHPGHRRRKSRRAGVAVREHCTSSSRRAGSGVLVEPARRVPAAGHDVRAQARRGFHGRG